jgi:phage terminase large subunit GpA-like protein
MPGAWRTDVAPFLREIMDCLSPDSGVELTVVMKPVQVGATEVLLNTAAYYLAHAPSTVMIVQPNQDMSKRLSRQRVEPMIDLCGQLKVLIAKQRSKGGNEAFLKTSRIGGTLVIASARSAAGLRSLPARIVLCDEVDSYLTDLGEGNPFDLAAARATTFGSQKRIAAISTPTYAGQSLIERLYNESDQRKWFVPCPFCGFSQTLDWENLRWEPGNPDTCRYRCVSCTHEIDESRRQEFLPTAVWKPTKSTNCAFSRSYHFNALISPWLRWSELVRQYEAAITPEAKKSFTNLILALPWQETVQPVPEAETLMARAEPYLEGMVPEGGSFLCAGVDVQSDRRKSRPWRGARISSPGASHITRFTAISLNRTSGTAWTSCWRDPGRMLAACRSQFRPAASTPVSPARKSRRSRATSTAGASMRPKACPRHSAGPSGRGGRVRTRTACRYTS